MAKTLFRSFAGGIITPEMFGRLDLTKFQTGLRDAFNTMTLPHGPAVRRPGTVFTQVGRYRSTSGSPLGVLLLPFIVSSTESVIVEVGYQYMRFHNSNGTELETAKVPSAVTVAAPGVFTIVGHGWSTGDWVYVENLPGMDSLEGRFYQVLVVSVDTFYLRELPNESVASPASISTVGLGAYTGSGSIARVYTLATTYTSTDIYDYAQNSSVMTLTSGGATRELRRYSAANWSLTSTSFAVTLAAPTGLVGTPTTATATNMTVAKYVVTSLAADLVTESVASSIVSITNNLTLAGNLNTIVFDPAVNATRYNVYKMRGGSYGYIGQVQPQPASPKAISAGERIYDELDPATWGRVLITATAHGYITGNVRYVRDTGVPSFDGMWSITVVDANSFTYVTSDYSPTTCSTGTVSSPTLEFIDDNISPDTITTPPTNDITLNTSTGEYPRATTYYEGRRLFGGTVNKPQNIWATRSGTDTNLTSSVPSRADDALEVRVVSQQRQNILHLVALQDVLVLTDSVVHRMFADGGPVLSVDTVAIKPQAAVGSSTVMPALAEDRALFVQAKGSYIRELAFDPSGIGRFTAENVSVMAPHLFDGYTIRQIAYTSAPLPALWVVRNDGALLGLTHMPTQQVYGWHRHEIADGEVESVAVIPEGNEDVLYMAVRRYATDGSSVTHIERMAQRVYSDPADAYFLDCGLTYSGTAVSSVSGLWHLEGRTVGILADGGVETPQVVTNGRVTISNPAEVIHVGLKYTSDIQLLPQTYEGAPASGQGTQKNVSKVFLRVKDSSLVKAGPRFNLLTALPARQVSDDYGSAPSPVTGEVTITVGPSWNSDGTICIRQDEPLPLNVLAVAHDTATGGG